MRLVTIHAQVEIKTVSQIPLTCLSHTSIFAPLKLGMHIFQFDLSSHVVVEGGLHRLTRTWDFIPEYLCLSFHHLQSSYGPGQLFDFTHSRQFIPMTYYVQNNENELVLQPNSHRSAYGPMFSKQNKRLE